MTYPQMCQMMSRLFRVQLLGLFVLLVTASPGRAALLTWTNTNSTGNWFAGANGWNGNATWANGDMPSFAGNSDVSRTITLQSDIVFTNRIEFLRSGYTLVGDVARTITSQGASNAAVIGLRISAGKTATIGTNITLNITNTGTTGPSQGGTLNVVNGAALIYAGIFKMDTTGTTVNVSNGASITATQFQIGDNGTHTVNVQGGTLSAGSMVLGIGNGVGSVVTLASGAINLSGTSVGASGQGLRIGSGGLTNPLASSTFNLDGGVLTAVQVITSVTNLIQTSTLNFNGGVLKALTNNLGAGGYWFVSGLDAANVKAGGAIIDSAGYNIAINQTLQHDAGLGGTADGGLTKLGAGTMFLLTNSTYTGATTISNGALVLSNAGGLSGQTAINVAGSGAVFQISQMAAGGSTNGSLAGVAGSSVVLGTKNLTVGGDGSSTVYAGVLSGTGGSLTKEGAGTMTLSGANTYSGGTIVQAGTLRVDNSTGSGTGAGALSVSNGATLMGSGTISGATTINGIHSPGNSPGLQTFDTNLTYNNGSSVIWELAANTATAGDRGTLFDGINVGGTLGFNGTVALNLVFNSAGSVVNWSDAIWTADQTWTIYSVSTSTTGFSNFQLATADWADGSANLFSSLLLGSSFALSQSGNNIVLNYDAVPEPSTYKLLALAAGGLGCHVVRRRRRAAL